MPRTTVNIEAPVFRELKRLQKRERKPLGQLISELLARALHEGRGAPVAKRPFVWNTQPMGARVDLADKDAVQAILDRDAGIETRP